MKKLSEMVIANSKNGVIRVDMGSIDNGKHRTNWLDYVTAGRIVDRLDQMNINENEFIIRVDCNQMDKETETWRTIPQVAVNYHITGKAKEVMNLFGTISAKLRAVRSYDYNGHSSMKRIELYQRTKTTVNTTSKFHCGYEDIKRTLLIEKNGKKRNIDINTIFSPGKMTDDIARKNIYLIDDHFHKNKLINLLKVLEVASSIVDELWEENMW